MTAQTAEIAGVAYHLPDAVLTNADLQRIYPEWTVERIAQKTGVDERHIAADGELSSDLAAAAARKLFETGVVAAAGIDYLLFCSQTPDYLLPTTACLLQHRLGIPSTAGALDFNLGCSGYVYGLGLAKALVETGQARNVLLLTGETYSKLLDPADKSVRTIFGDAGTATLVRAGNRPGSMGPFVYGTDGSGGKNLICTRGALRSGRQDGEALSMNGPEVFDFTLKAVPAAVHRTLKAAAMAMADVDLFVFHQANMYMLEHLRRKLQVPAERFVVDMKDVGNTVSCTIPIALSRAASSGRLVQGMRLMLVGFGVGYSWAAMVGRWTAGPTERT